MWWTEDKFSHLADVAVYLFSGTGDPIMDSAALSHLYVGTVGFKVGIVGLENIFNFEDIRNIQEVMIAFSTFALWGMTRDNAWRELSNGATRPNIGVRAVRIGAQIIHPIRAGGFIECALRVSGSR